MNRQDKFEQLRALIEKEYYHAAQSIEDINESERKMSPAEREHWGSDLKEVRYGRSCRLSALGDLKRAAEQIARNN